MDDGGLLTIALGIPHTPWVPERVASLDRAGKTLFESASGPLSTRLFTDQAPNHVWSVDLWTWLRDTGAAWGIQLQDDVVVAPYFWPAIRAMLGALPADAQVVGLANVHPMASEIARRGQRWFLSPGHVVGWAYAMRHSALERFLADRETYDAGFLAMNEDEQIGEWCRRIQIPVWHPVPTLVDHDTSIPSTYQNDRHTHKRPPVTWRDYTEASLSDPSWWKPDTSLEILPVPPQRACWFCFKNPPAFGSETGCQLCQICVLRCVGKSLGIQVNG
jgi:hypothetical protein